MQSSPKRDFDISLEPRRRFVLLKLLTSIIFLLPAMNDQRRGILRIQHLCFSAISREVGQSVKARKDPIFREETKQRKKYQKKDQITKQNSRKRKDNTETKNI